MVKLFFLFIFLISYPLYAIVPIDISQDNFEGRGFGKQSYYYLGDADIEDVSSSKFSDNFVLGTNEKHSFSMKFPSFWIKASFLNPFTVSKKLYIADSSNFAERFSAFVDRDIVGELYHKDTLLNRIIEIPLAANSTTTIYINRLSYGSQRQSWTYWTDKEKMIASLKDSEQTWSVVIAILAMSLLFNVMLFYAFRSKVYLYYIAYLLTGSAFTTAVWSIIGITNHSQFTLSMVIITGINAALFSIEFLRLSTKMPKARKVLLGVIVLWTVPLILLHFKPFLAFRLTTIVAVIFASTCIIIALRVYWRTRATHALIYSIAYGVFMLGILIQIAIYRGLIPILVNYAHLIMHGGVLGDILMLMAMGYEVHKTETDRKESHEKLKKYVGKVQTLVDEKTRDIRSMMENIPQGIFTIHSDENSPRGGTIDAEHSTWLLFFTGEKDLANQSVYDKILSRTNLSNDELDKTVNSLDLSFNENILNFEGNQDLLVSSCSFKLENGRNAEVEFEWSPILDANGNIEKFLVTIRDVSEVMKLRRQAEDYFRETSILSEIARADEQKFSKFIATAFQFVEENISILENATELDRDILKTIFINLHTLKGISRSLKLSTISTSIHDEETVFAGYRSLDKEIELNKNEIKDRQLVLLSLIQEYSRVNMEVLHRKNKESVLSVDRFIIQDTLDSLAKINVAQLIKSDSNIIENIHQILMGILFHSSNEFYDDLKIVINTLARDLGKEQPEIKIAGDEVMYTSRAMDLLKQVFIHLVRNILDHGLEYPEVRSSKGKNPSGTITIHTSTNPNFVVFTVSDDGAGLNLAKIREVAIINKILDPNTKLTNYETANLIFENGLSTSQKETEISGRGVGMAAVKKFVERVGGQLTLLLGQELKDGNISFSTQILLPAEFFRFTAKSQKAS